MNPQTVAPPGPPLQNGRARTGTASPLASSHKPCAPGSPPPEVEYAAERAPSVERSIAATRLLLLVFGGGVYAFLMDHAGTIPWLAYLCVGLGSVYAAFLYAASLFAIVGRRAPAYVTSIGDALFLMVWLMATGGVHSEFYVFVYASVIAVAFQHGFRDAVLAAILYAVSYLVLLVLLGQVNAHVADVVIRVGGVLFIAPFGALLAREAFVQGGARLEMQALALAARRAEEELKRANHFRERVMDSATNAIFAYDCEGRFTFINRAATEIGDYPAEELLGRHFSVVFPPANRPSAEEWFHRAAVRGLVVSGQEMEIIRRDGQRRVARFSLAPLTEGGQISGVVGTAEDVTERREAERELARSLSLLRATLEAGADGILVVDREGHIVTFNQRFVEIWGISQSILDARDDDLALAYVLEQLKDPQAFLGRVRQLYAHPDAESFDVLEFKDGRILERYSRPQRIDGQSVGRVWSFRDVTERRRAVVALQQSEEKYRTLFEESKDAVFIATPGGKLLDINPAGVELFGFGSKEEMRGADALSFFLHPEDQAAAHEALTTTGFVKDMPLELSRRNGEKLSVLVTATAQRDANGSVVTIRGVTRDVTTQKRLEAELRRAQKLEAVGRLAAGVAHEINNPLTYMLSNLQSLSEELPRLAISGDLLADLSRRVAETAEGAERVRRIVRDLKAFSRMEEETRTAIDLNRVVGKAVSLSANQIRHRARLVQAFAAIPPLLADEGRLSQVVLNLLLNAYEAIEEGSPEQNEIRVRTGAGAGEVFLEVVDTGRGIAPEDLERLFDPFFTRKFVGGGSLGLGLSICHNIVTSYGGRMDVESSPGKGSRFVVWLPAEKLQTVAPAVGSMAGAVPGKQRRGRILVVDDETPVRRAAATVLRTEHEVVEAGTGREALALLDGPPRFDVILCDLMMPDVSGMELYRALRSRAPELARHIVFMTGGVFTRGAEEFLSKASLPCLEKPFSAPELLRIIGEIVAAQRTPAEATTADGV